MISGHLHHPPLRRKRRQSGSLEHGPLCPFPDFNNLKHLLRMQKAQAIRIALE